MEYFLQKELLTDMAFSKPYIVFELTITILMVFWMIRLRFDVNFMTLVYVVMMSLNFCFTAFLYKIIWIFWLYFRISWYSYGCLFGDKCHLKEKERRSARLSSSGNVVLWQRYSLAQVCFLYLMKEIIFLFSFEILS